MRRAPAHLDKGEVPTGVPGLVARARVLHQGVPGARAQHRLALQARVGAYALAVHAVQAPARARTP